MDIKNLKRYNTNAVGMAGHVDMFEFSEGEYVKFSELEEALSSTSTNTQRVPCPGCGELMVPGSFCCYEGHRIEYHDD